MGNAAYEIVKELILKILLRVNYDFIKLKIINQVYMDILFFERRMRRNRASPKMEVLVRWKWKIHVPPNLVNIRNLMLSLCCYKGLPPDRSFAIPGHGRIMLHYRKMIHCMRCANTTLALLLREWYACWWCFYLATLPTRNKETEAKFGGISQFHWKFTRGDSPILRSMEPIFWAISRKTWSDGCERKSGRLEKAAAWAHRRISRCQDNSQYFRSQGKKAISTGIFEDNGE